MCIVYMLMTRQTPNATRTDTLFPDTTLFRSFTGLAINGNTYGVGGDLLIVLGRSEGFAPLIADALTQNFTHDLTELQGKIRRAVDQRREGAFVLDRKSVV